MRTAWWFDYVYRQNFWLVVTPSEAELLAWARRRLGVALPPPGDTVRGRATEILLDGGNHGVLVWLHSFDEHSPESAATLAHEMFHAAAMTLGYRGVSVGSRDAEEAMAYYIQFLVRQAMEKLADKRTGGSR